MAIFQERFISLCNGRDSLLNDLLTARIAVQNVRRTSAPALLHGTLGLRASPDEKAASHGPKKSVGKSYVDSRPRVGCPPSRKVLLAQRSLMDHCLSDRRILSRWDLARCYRRL